MAKRRKKKKIEVFIIVLVIFFVSIGYLINQAQPYFDKANLFYNENKFFLNFSLGTIIFLLTACFIYINLPFIIKHKIKCLILGYSKNPKVIIEKLNSNIQQLENIKNSKGRVIDLEVLCADSLELLTPDGVTKPNYKIDQFGNPNSHAPKNVPDCEFFSSFNMIVEVTNMENKNQWLSEGQPIMRHLRDFENKYKKEAFCLFIAPTIHRDALNTYYMANKYEYEGKKTKIIPITIEHWNIILKYVCHKYKTQHGFSFNSTNLEKLLNYFYKQIENTNDSNTWLEKIDKEVKKLKVSNK